MPTHSSEKRASNPQGKMWRNEEIGGNLAKLRNWEKIEEMGEKFSKIGKLGEIRNGTCKFRVISDRFQIFYFFINAMLRNVKYRNKIKTKILM